MILGLFSNLSVKNMPLVTILSSRIPWILLQLKKKAYTNRQEFAHDIFLVFDNCETYNGTESSYTQMAFKLKKLFDKQMKREFPAVVEDDDDDFFGESRGRGKKQAKSVKSDTSVQSKQGLSKPPKIAPQKVTQVAGTSNTVNNTASPASRRKSIKKTTTNAVDMPKLAPAGMHSALVNGINVNGQTISPEFARAQILATQAKIKSQNQTQANISNVLPTRFS